jgi:hypothetical protein
MNIDNLELKQHFIKSLNERQLRQFAALESKQLGHGGIKMASEAFGVSVVTIREGIQELDSKEALPPGRIRRPGGGRKKNIIK